MIKIRNLTKKYPSVTALDGINMEIRGGEFFGLLGPNGAGKSTLMNILAGYLDPDSGSVTLNDQPAGQNNLNIRYTTGLIPQSIALYEDISAQENLFIFGSLYNIPRQQLKSAVQEKLNSAGLYERRKEKVKNFSGGMKRRLNLIAGLLHEPEVILCDEPTVGVDPQSRNAIFEYLLKLNEDGRTIIYTTHYMEEAERLCSRLAIIDSGRIISEGTVDEMIFSLPYQQTIIIKKDPAAIHNISVFRNFGEVTDEQDFFEMKPSENFRLSSFFESVEKNGISYKSIELKRPSLEALFLHLTGRSLRD